MPDVDIVQERVTRKFKRAYEQLCEGFLSYEELSEVIAKALRNTLKKEGNPPIELIFYALRRVFDEGAGKKPINNIDAGFLIDHLASESMSNPRYTAIAQDAFKAGVERSKNLQDQTDMSNEVVREYVTRVLAADFYKSMPLTNHYNGVSTQEINERLQQVYPHVEHEIAYIVKQIVRDESATRLRKKRKKRNSNPNFGDMDISMPKSPHDGGD